MEKLGAPAGSWTVAPDVAFAYRSEYSLTAENEGEVAALRERLATVRDGGTAVVALVPSSLVHQKMGEGYVELLGAVVADLRRRGAHVLVMPNATRAGLDVPRNNDITVIALLRERLGAGAEDVDYVDYDLNTAAIRSL